MNNVLAKKYIPKLSLEEFLDTSKPYVLEYSCPLCEGILFESVIDRCGHSYCKNCLDLLLQDVTYCLFTNNPINYSEISTNIVVNSVIEKQQVYCKNKIDGCEWAGKLLERKNHLLFDCIKETIVCEYINCNKPIPRDELNTHKLDCPHRVITCHHCSETVSFNDIEDHYKNGCLNFPTECTNGCNIKVPVSKMKLHINSYCDNTTTECPFILVGCSFFDIRKELKVHLNENLEDHLKLIAGKIKTLNDITILQKREIDSVRLVNEHIRKDLKITNDLINRNNSNLLNLIDLLSKRLDNVKEYLTVPVCNCVPVFQKNEIFKIDNNVISKLNLNYGWYGIASDKINMDKLDKLIVNLKIKKTANSCIMFGVTFNGNYSVPVINGFYQQTEESITGYMFYCYNYSIYYKGRATNING
jgi:hypothetical protein